MLRELSQRAQAELGLVQLRMKAGVAWLLLCSYRKDIGKSSVAPAMHMPSLVSVDLAVLAETSADWPSAVRSTSCK